MPSVGSTAWPRTVTDSHERGDPARGSSAAAGFELPLALALVIGLLIGFQPIPADPDLWFHLADGEAILAGGGVPMTDPYSFTRAGEPWVPHSWLFDVGVAAMWHAMGPRAAEAVFALIYMVALAASFHVLASSGVDPMKALLAVAALAVAAGNTRGLRPQVLSLLLANLLLLALVAHRRRPGVWLTAALSLLFVLWAQVHAGCVMGVAILGIWTAGGAVDAFRVALLRRNSPARLPGPADRGREIVMLTAALVASALAVLVTPHTITHYEYVCLTAELAFLRNHVAEWLPPQLWPLAVPDLYHYLLTLGVAAATVRWRLRRRSAAAGRAWGRQASPTTGEGSIDVASLGVAVFTLAIGFAATRHVPLACIGCVPLLAGLLGGGSSVSDGRHGAVTAYGAPRLFSQWTRADARAVAVFAPIALALLLGFWRFPTTIAKRYEAAEPVRGAAALKALDVPLRVFTTYDTGAYVLWSAPGRLRVFVDSRADVYRDELLYNAYAAAAGHKWKPLFAQWDVQAAVLGRNDGLARMLADDPGWKLLARDEDSVTFLSAAVSRAARAVP